MSRPSAPAPASAGSQCLSRSRPPGVSDHGREPSLLGAHSRQRQPPSRDCTASAHMPITTVPSERRTPLQLWRAFSRYTPRASKAALREMRRRALARADGVARGRLVQVARTVLHNSATSDSPSAMAFARSCSISSRSSLAMRSMGHSSTRLPKGAGTLILLVITPYTPPHAPPADYLRSPNVLSPVGLSTTLCRCSPTCRANRSRRKAPAASYWSMAKEALLTMVGIVEEVLRNTQFRVSTANGASVLAYASARLR